MSLGFRRSRFAAAFRAKKVPARWAQGRAAPSGRRRPKARASDGPSRVLADLAEDGVQRLQRLYGVGSAGGLPEGSDSGGLGSFGLLSLEVREIRLARKERPTRGARGDLGIRSVCEFSFIDLGGFESCATSAQEG